MRAAWMATARSARRPGQHTGPALTIETIAVVETPTARGNQHHGPRRKRTPCIKIRAAGGRPGTRHVVTAGERDGGRQA
jgi:hypothetical protein